VGTMGTQPLGVSRSPSPRVTVPNLVTLGQTVRAVKSKSLKFVGTDTHIDRLPMNSY